MFNDELILVSRKPSAQRGPRGQVLYTEDKHAVLCEVFPVSRDEYFKGGEIGINPEFEFKVNPIEYNGEKVIEYGGRRFNIYRIYKAGPDTLELYAEYLPGMNDGSNDNGGAQNDS